MKKNIQYYSIFILIIFLINISYVTTSSAADDVEDQGLGKITKYLGKMSEALTKAAAYWKDAKDAYRAVKDQAQQAYIIYQQYQQIMQYYEMIQSMARAVKNFNPTDLMSFISQMEGIIGAVDNMFDQTEGLLNKVEDTNDAINALYPRLEGLATFDSRDWHDLITKNEEQKYYSVKNTMREYGELRTKWKLAKKQLRELQDQNAKVENYVQAQQVTNNILFAQRTQLQEIERKIVQQTQLLATTTIHMEHQKKAMEAESKRRMTLENKPVSVKGVGDIEFKPFYN